MNEGGLVRTHGRSTRRIDLWRHADAGVPGGVDLPFKLSLYSQSLLERQFAFETGIGAQQFDVEPGPGLDIDRKSAA